MARHKELFKIHSTPIAAQLPLGQKLTNIHDDQQESSVYNVAASQVAKLTKRENHCYDVDVGDGHLSMASIAQRARARHR